MIEFISLLDFFFSGNKSYYLWLKLENAMVRINLFDFISVEFNNIQDMFTYKNDMEISKPKSLVHEKKEG